MPNPPGRGLVRLANSAACLYRVRAAHSLGGFAYHLPYLGIPAPSSVESKDTLPFSHPSRRDPNHATQLVEQVPIWQPEKAPKGEAGASKSSGVAASRPAPLERNLPSHPRARPQLLGGQSGSAVSCRVEAAWSTRGKSCGSVVLPLLQTPSSALDISVESCCCLSKEY